ncbi:MAG TPA: iron ABC transporter permease [Solirubrobacterales bacterium]|nr:iron ABC transporter permease [Solirubrobacterales bacterium]
MAVATAIPALYLGIAIADNLPSAWDALWRSRTAEMAIRSLGLAATVTATAVAVAVPLAWLTTRTDLPARRLWATLTTLPLVIPSYIGAYLFIAALGPKGALQDLLEPLGVDRLPSLYGFPGAWLVLTLFTYPLVLITVRAALARLDPMLEEAARGMGRSPAEVFRTVVLPQLFPAIGAGALLVALYVLSDFGAVSLLRFDSFTREIYISYTASFDRTGAAALGALLVAMTVAILWLYGRMRRRLEYHRVGPGAARPQRAVSLGRWRWPALGFCAMVTLVALVIPVAVLVYWATKSLSSGVDASTLVTNAGHSLLAGTLAAAAAGTSALVVALLAVRGGRFGTLVERLSYSGYALPGIVIALALIYFGIRVAEPLYQTLAMLIFALSVHYLPLAVGASIAALLQVSPRTEEAARLLGRGPVAVFRTVTTPLVRGGLLAGAALVFLHAIKELPATLLLAPIGFDTLATEIWNQTGSGFFEAAAIPSLVLLAVAAPPLYLLSEKGVAS